MAGKKGQRSKKLAVIDRKRSAVRRAGGLDGRTRDARYLRATAQRLCEDLGGTEDLSVQQQALVTEAAFTLARLHRMKQDFAAGRAFDDRSYSALQNSLLGILRTLGIERKAKRAGGLLEMLKADAGGAAGK
jgi:hypothetical protein